MDRSHYRMHVRTGVQCALGLSWLALAGCTQSPDGSAPRTAPAIEQRDAFYDGVRLGEDVVVVIGKHGKILRSDDGGRHWTSAPSGVTRPLFGIAFRDQSHGAVVGARGLYLETTDRGDTWTVRRLGVQRQLFAILFVDNGAGVIVGEFGTVLRSDRPGADWKVIAIDWEQVLPELTEKVGLVEPHLYDVAFCDALHGWVVGEYGLVLASRDGGKTWERQRGGGLFDPQLFAVTCTGDGQLVAVGQAGQVLHTANRGSEWTPVSVAEHHDLYDVTTLDAKGGLLAVGDLGSALVSTESGRPGSWSLVSESADGSAALLGHAWLAKAIPLPTEVLVLGEAGVTHLPVARLARAHRHQG